MKNGYICQTDSRVEGYIDVKCEIQDVNEFVLKCYINNDLLFEVVNKKIAKQITRDLTRLFDMYDENK